MKTLYTLCAISFSVLSATALSAQISVAPNPVVIDEMDFEAYETVAYATLTNESEQLLNITWTREEIQLPEGWSTAVCDFTTCHFQWISTQSFEAAVGAEGALDVHVYPNGIEGSAVVAVHLESPDLPEFEMTVMYYFNTALGVSERLYQNFQVYPNPTADFVRIEAESNVQSVDIFDIQGRLVKQVSLAGSEIVQMSDLPTGKYILRMKDMRGDLLSSNVVIRL